ncbi:hypothetical protein AGLY_010828, partial [Aphis glycines]
VIKDSFTVHIQFSMTLKYVCLKSLMKFIVLVNSHPKFVSINHPYDWITVQKMKLVFHMLSSLFENLSCILQLSNNSLISHSTCGNFLNKKFTDFPTFGRMCCFKETSSHNELFNAFDFTKLPTESLWINTFNGGCLISKFPINAAIICMSVGGAINESLAIRLTNAATSNSENNFLEINQLLGTS